MHHNDTISIQTQGQRCRKEDTRRLLYKYFTSHFIARFEKGYSKFACERVLETEHKLHILTPTIMTVMLCLYCSPDVGVYSIGAFPRAPSVGCSLPYHIWSLAVWNSAGNCIGGFWGPPRSGVAFPTSSCL